MKRSQLVALVVVVLVVAAAVLVVGFRKNPTAQADACTKTGELHQMIIEHDVVTPSRITTNRCDRLQITNLDTQTRRIGFGEHDHHQAYNGVDDVILQKGKSLKVTLTQTGEFHFHDHYHEETAGSFIVN